MNRRGFLKSSLVLGAGLVVGAEALEAMERLTHQRKSFASAGWSETIYGYGNSGERITAGEIIRRNAQKMAELERVYVESLMKFNPILAGVRWKAAV